MPEESEAVNISGKSIRAPIITRRSALRTGYFGISLIALFGFMQLLKLFGIDFNFNLIHYYILVDYAILSIGLFLILISALIFSGIYLEVFGDNEVIRRPAEQSEIDAIRTELRTIERRQLRRYPAFSDRTLESLIESSFHRNIKRNIENLTSESIKEILTERIISNNSEQIVRDRNLLRLESYVSNSTKLLHDQIIKQGKNANFNVWAGLVFAVCGLLAMALFTWFYYTDIAKASEQSWDQFAKNYVPKAAFVLLFESIAFFFLRAYGEDRSMIRYIRNETTNVEAKFSGLTASILFADPKTIDSAIKSLMSTERNFTIKKGEKFILQDFASSQPAAFESLLHNILSTVTKQKTNNHASPDRQ